MKHAIVLFLCLLIALLACGGITTMEPNDTAGVSQETLDEYRIKCKAGCQSLMELEDHDGEKPCEQAREHDGLVCEDYCVRKMQKDSYTDPDCWKELESCSEFEERCHFGEMY
jgi:hypothetical protein